MGERAGRSRTSPTRVALVDDHRLVLDGIMAFIASKRLDIDIVASECTWEGLLTSETHPADVVVLELNLGDGIPISSKIRCLTAAGSKTIIMSRHSDGPAVSGALRAGAHAFVPKTESADELISAIQAVAAGLPYDNRAAQSATWSMVSTRDPKLGRQEQRATLLYAGGRSIKEVADEMSTTEETVKSYIKRARRKYRSVGVDVGTKILLRRQGIHEGWLTPE